MIASPTLSDLELRVWIAIRSAWNLIGSMPDATELAQLAQMSRGQCRLAINRLADKHLLVQLPDGGWAPVESRA